MKPIIFNTQMVQAILEGRKTQTRRVIKPQPICFTGRNFVFADDECPKKWEQCEDFLSTAPYRPGDVLWVRETWCKVPGLPPYVYKASCYDGGARKWRPSIHMPREAARIFLRVTAVRVERLQDIDENGAIAEGLYKGWRLHGRGSLALSARQAFMWLWRVITLKNTAAVSWACNPWVWVIEFEQCEKGG